MYNLRFKKKSKKTVYKLVDVLVGENFISSLASFLMTLPVLVINFNSFNILSIPINLLILWPIPFILQAGGILGILGLFGKAGLALAKVASYPLYLLLLYIEQLIGLFDKIKFVRILNLTILPILAYFYYLIVAIWVYREEKLGIRN
jgi:hypothetical protein